MSITINVTPTTGGSFTAAGVESGNITLTVGGGIGPPGAGNVALAAGAGIAITSTANVATITSTVQGVTASNLADLADVDATAPTSGQVLEWNGTAWAPGLDSTLTLASDAGADLGTAAAGSAGVAARADHVHNLPTFSEITNGTATVTGNLTLNASTGGVIVNGGSQAGSLTLNCEQNTHGVTIASPAHSAGASYTLTLPATAGSANQVLTTDGNGSLSWSNGTGGGGIVWSSEPTASNSTGSAGQIAYGSGFFYLHDGTFWRRAALATFGGTAPTITITSQPQSMTLAVGGSGNFTIAATVSDASSPSYQWQNSDDGGATWDTITGATGTTYSVANVSTLDNGTEYRAVVSASNAASVTSNVAILTVGQTSNLLTEGGDTLATEAGNQLAYDGLGSYPGGGGGGSAMLTFSSQPASQEITATAASTTVTFNATATHSDGDAVSYQWQELPSGGSWTNLSGETHDNLSLTAYQGTSRRQYRVVATSGALQETSAAATLTMHTEVNNGQQYVADLGGGYWPMQPTYHSTGTFANTTTLPDVTATDTTSISTAVDYYNCIFHYMEVFKDGSSVASQYNSTGLSGFYWDGSAYQFLAANQQFASSNPLPPGEYRLQARVKYNSVDYSESMSTHPFDA